MFEHYFFGMQQDLKLAVLPPLLCAVFRYIFILRYAPKKTPFGDWKKWYLCFNYGFWWGWDVNAYAYLIPLILVTLPGAFIESYYVAGDSVRLVLMGTYCLLLYAAFIGKLIFYYHYQDKLNRTVWLAKHADKKNYADIFFNQHHGALLLLGTVVYLAVCTVVGKYLLALPLLSYPKVEGYLHDIIGVTFFLGSVAIFYWFRFGGTFRHRLKPEWDEIPPIVKEDMFMAKVCEDDLVALHSIWRNPVSDIIAHSDEQSEEIMRPVLNGSILNTKDPMRHFLRNASGSRIKKPSHIFFLFAESHSQSAFDPIYEEMHLMDASKRFRSDKHTFSLQNFLSAGLNSRPSLNSILTGIFDPEMELNENNHFWKSTVPSSLPLQLKRLGYKTSFWYGGELTHGSLEHFMPALGFDEAFGGPSICEKGSPQTWLGVYDHLFLEEVGRRIKANVSDTPEFHFIYTTSNHGPYLLPFDKLGFDIDKVMPNMPEGMKKDKAVWRTLGASWYADQALIRLAEEMKEAFPDSMIIITGDHSSPLIPFQYDVVDRKEPALREKYLASFAIYHRELTEDMFAGNTIGGHMNIMPTIFELIAPKGFAYYGLMPSLTEPIEHVVTPYCWMTNDTIGVYNDRIAQSIKVSSEMLPMKMDTVLFEDEMHGWTEITAWMVKHPELLKDSGTREIPMSEGLENNRRTLAYQ